MDGVTDYLFLRGGRWGDVSGRGGEAFLITRPREVGRENERPQHRSSLRGW